MYSDFWRYSCTQNSVDKVNCQYTRPETKNAFGNKDLIPTFQTREKSSEDSIQLDSLSPRVSYSNIWISACYRKLGDVEKSRQYYPLAVKPV